jgi:predicted transcriptional regulator
MSEQPKREPIALTPEHDERIRRIATATGRKPEQVLADAVTEFWVRFAARGRLSPTQW